MPDSSLKNLGLHENFSDDELKVGALVDGLATGSAAKAGGDGPANHPHQADMAGGDFAFTLGDGFSITFNLDHILSKAHGVYDTGFSIVQANSLADQDRAYDIRMHNQGEANADAPGETATAGLDVADGWDLKVDEDPAAGSLADASTGLADAAFHHEIVQGANLLSHAVDAAGDDPRLTPVGTDGDVD